jgi:hypothetical protein
MRRLIFALMVFMTPACLVTPAYLALASEPARTGTLYKNPECTCCDEYARYLRDHGFQIDVIETPTLDLVKAEHGVPEALGGCHTTLIDGYVVEGHVPVGSIERLLNERPQIAGISLPGMPSGSPGMGGPREGPFEIMSFGKGEPALFALE